MLRCWQYKPNERPSFIDIVRELLPALRPDFLKMSFFGTLSPAEQLGMATNHQKVKNEVSSSQQQAGEEAYTNEDDDTQSQQQQRLSLKSDEVAGKAVANIYNVVDAKQRSATDPIAYKGGSSSDNSSSV